MKITKQYLRKLIVEQLQDEGIEVPGRPHGDYDEEGKFQLGSGPNPEEALLTMLASLSSLVISNQPDMAEVRELVAQIRSMVVQFTKATYTGGPAYTADYVSRIRKGKA